MPDNNNTQPRRQQPVRPNLPPPVKPNLAPLNSMLRNLLITQCNTVSVDHVLHYLQTEEITFDELPNLTDARKAELEKRLKEWKEMPNADEHAEWTEIDKFVKQQPNDKQRLVAKLEDYIDHWKESLPKDNHVEEAKNMLSELVRDVLAEKERRDWERLPAEIPDNMPAINDFIRKCDNYLSSYEQYGDDAFHVGEARRRRHDAAAKLEEVEFRSVDLFNELSVKNYLRSHPDSVHAEELAEVLWGFTVSNLTRSRLESFINLCPESSHINEARNSLAEFAEWEPITSNRDIFEVYNFLHNHPDGTFRQPAEQLLRELHDAEIDEMRADPSRYDGDRCLQLIDAGIVTIQELWRYGIATEDSIRKLREVEQFKNAYQVTDDHYVDYSQESDDDDPDVTDVFLFGIPATGKTCVLEGLLMSDKFNWNVHISAGRYGQLLTDYGDAGILPPPTRSTFIAKMRGYIEDAEGKRHHINLIEMSGEEFATKLAQNENHQITIDEMGDGASMLLSQNHKKIFFFIIDPTVERVRFTHEVTRQYPDGTVDTQIVQLGVRQSNVLRSMVNLLCLPENEKILRNVDSMHFIATKADMLYDKGNPEEVAKNLVQQRYSTLLRPMLDICDPRNYEINAATNYKPRLYTYSLGKFYVGGVYEFDPLDADKLINVISGNTRSLKPNSFFDKVKKLFNTEILK